MKKAEYLTPVVTIFDRVGNIDQKGNEMVYDFLIKGGVDGIVVMGSTGEFFAMSMEQKKRLIDIAVPYIKGKVKCMIGTGCMSVRDTVELSNYACDAGADAVMIVCPSAQKILKPIMIRSCPRYAARYSFTTIPVRPVMM